MSKLGSISELNVLSVSFPVKSESSLQYAVCDIISQPSDSLSVSFDGRSHMSEVEFGSGTVWVFTTELLHLLNHEPETLNFL